MAKILVIDDNADLLETIRQILEQRGGHQAILSTNGPDGLSKAVSDPPDLAIVDVMMPGISGYEVCRELRANPVTASIPILIFTARGQPVDRQAALDAGADDYMVKPVTMQELVERVNSLLALRTVEKAPAVVGTIVLLSLRGGVGVTTLAVNLAAILAMAGDGATCLVDLCPSSGHAALQLGLRPEPNWSGLIQMGIPDEEVIKGHLLQHTSGLQVLASPLFPVTGQGLSKKALQAMLKILQRQFAILVVDAPPVLSEAALATMEAATVVGLVITAEAPSVQTAIGTLRALKEWSGKFRIILNQVTTGPQMPTGAIEQALRRPLMARIPFDSAQARALAQRTPLALHSPASPLAQAIQEIAQEFIQTARKTVVSQ